MDGQQLTPPISDSERALRAQADHAAYISFWLLPDVMKELPRQVGLDFDMTQVSFAIYGYLLVIMMILRFQGLLLERKDP